MFAKPICLAVTFLAFAFTPSLKAFRVFRRTIHSAVARITLDGDVEATCLLQIRGGEIQRPASLEDLDSILEKASDKLVVIDFYSNDCPPCEKVAPLYQELSESEEFADNVVFLKVNVDEQPSITAKYQVTGWPTFIFIKAGRVLTEIVGGNLAEATLYDWVKLLVPKDGSKE